jgi:hypothetical protein
MFNYKNKFIEKIDDVIDKLPAKCTLNVIDLSDNEITNARLDLLPSYIKNVSLENNSLDNITWDDRVWGTIKLNNNCIDFEEINNLTCKKLDVSDNKFQGEITFINCKIDELNISNNKIKCLNFVECIIKKLDISLNNIYEITHLPDGIIDLNASDNRICDLCDLPDTMYIVDLSKNKLESIKNIPSNLNKLDLSKNKLKEFNFDILPENLDYLDISNNFIPNVKKLISGFGVEQIFYDSEDYNVTNHIDSDDDISLVVKSKSNENTSEINSDSNSNSDSDSDSDSNSNSDPFMSSTAVKISKNPRVYKIDPGSDNELEITTDIEKEFLMLNSKLNNKHITGSESESESGSESDDDIGDVVAKYRSGIESNKSNDNIAELEESEELEDIGKKRELQLNAALFREKLLQEQKVVKYEENCGDKKEIHVFTEEHKEIIEILKSKSQKKQIVYSKKIQVETQWALIL